MTLTTRSKPRAHMRQRLKRTNARGVRQLRRLRRLRKDMQINQLAELGAGGGRVVGDARTVRRAVVTAAPPAADIRAARAAPGSAGAGKGDAWASSRDSMASQNRPATAADRNLGHSPACRANTDVRQPASVTARSNFSPSAASSSRGKQQYGSSTSSAWAGMFEARQGRPAAIPSINGSENPSSREALTMAKALP